MIGTEGYDRKQGVDLNPSSDFGESPMQQRQRLGSNSETIEVKTERFWSLFLFGCCTCVNACGWIAMAPIFLLVEDVSDILNWPNPFICITAL